MKRRLNIKMKSTLTKGKTPKGMAMYPYLKNPETYEGNEIGYTIQLILNEKDTQSFIAILEKELSVAQKAPFFEGKKWARTPHLSYRENNDGDIVFKFKTKHVIKTKNGDEIKRTVPIFDSKGKPIDVTIGNGSIVRLAYTIVPYHKSSTNNGLTLYLDAVQVINLVEYQGTHSTAEAFGFEEEEGYSSDDEQAEVIDDLDDIENNEDDSGDF